MKTELSSVFFFLFVCFFNVQIFFFPTVFGFKTTQLFSFIEAYKTEFHNFDDCGSDVNLHVFTLGFYKLFGAAEYEGG